MVQSNTITRSITNTPKYEALHQFKQQISALLQRQKNNIEQGEQTKITFDLHKDALTFWHQYRIELES